MVADDMLDTVVLVQLARSVSGSKEVEKLQPCIVAAALLAGTVTEEEQCGGVAEKLANTVAGKLQGCIAVSAVAGQQLAGTAAGESQGCIGLLGFYCWAL